MQVEGNSDSAIFRRQLLLSDDTAFHIQIAEADLDSAGAAALHVQVDRPAVDAQLTEINLQVGCDQCRNCRDAKGHTLYMFNRYVLTGAQDAEVELKGGATSQGVSKAASKS